MNLRRKNNSSSSHCNCRYPMLQRVSSSAFRQWCKGIDGSFKNRISLKSKKQYSSKLALVNFVHQKSRFTSIYPGPIVSPSSYNHWNEVKSTVRYYSNEIPRQGQMNDNEIDETFWKQETPEHEQEYEEFKSIALQSSTESSLENRSMHKKLHELRVSGDLFGAIELARSSIESGEVVADQEIYVLYLSICATGRYLVGLRRAFESYLKDLEKGNILPHSFIFAVYVRGLCKCKQYDEALEAFYSIPEKYHVPITTYAYKELLHYLGATITHRHLAERVWHEYLLKTDIAPSSSVYASALQMYAQAWDWEQVDKVFELAGSMGVIFSPADIRRITHPSVRNSKYMSTLLYQKIVKTPSSSSVQVDWYLSTVQNMEDIERTVASMSYAGIPMSVLILNRLLNHVKDFKEAHQFAKTFCQQFAVSPNSMTYFRLLYWAATPAHESRVAFVNDLTQEMVDRGMEFGEEHLTVLIRFYSIIGQQQTAKALSSSLIDKLETNVYTSPTYDALLRLHAFGGELSVLSKVWNQVHKNNVPLSPSTIDIIFKTRLQRSSLEFCHIVIRSLLIRSQPVSPRHIMSLLVHLYQRSHHFVGASFSQSSQSSTSSYSVASSNNSVFSLKRFRTKLYNASYRSNEFKPTITYCEEYIAEHEKNNRRPTRAKLSNPNKAYTQRTYALCSNDWYIICDLHSQLIHNPVLIHSLPPQYWQIYISVQRNAGTLSRSTLDALQWLKTPQDRSIIIAEFLRLLPAFSIKSRVPVSQWMKKFEEKHILDQKLQEEFTWFVQSIVSNQFPHSIPTTASVTKSLRGTTYEHFKDLMAQDFDNQE